MARVTGVGGVFLRSADPVRLAAWYTRHLHLPLSSYGGVNFEWSDQVPPGTGTTAWSVFPADTAYFGAAAEPRQQAMINYRVDDLDSLLQELGEAGVWIDPKREDHAYGRFAWIQDCDGNRLELWQPMPETPDPS